MVRLQNIYKKNIVAKPVFLNAFLYIKYRDSMKVVIPCNISRKLVPLDMADIILGYDSNDGSIIEEENSGFGSKEATMAFILRLSADVITVKEGMLCPGSYMMSQGSIKYSIVKSDNADDVIKNKEYAEAVDQLPENMFAE